MIAPEGYSTIVVLLVLVVLAALLTWFRKKAYTFIILIITLLLLGLSIFFFRDPQILLPPSDKIVAPTHGTIIEINHTPEGITQLTMFLSLFDQHAIRVPASGTILSSQYFPGKYHPAYLPKAGRENEHICLELETEYGVIVQRVLAGVVARRVICSLKPGDRVLAGQRVGFIRFGSRAELELPSGFQCQVRVGDHLKGGITLLGEFVTGFNSE